MKGRCGMSNNSWDTQVGGDHYKKYKIQPMHYSMSNDLNPLQHSVIKYVTRYLDKKAPVDDLRKARHCIDMLIDVELDKTYKEKESLNLLVKGK